MKDTETIQGELAAAPVKKAKKRPAAKATSTTPVKRLRLTESALFLAVAADGKSAELVGAGGSVAEYRALAVAGLRDGLYKEAMILKGGSMRFRRVARVN